MLQGVLLGLGMCFLIFSLFQAVNLRDLFFLKYALLISGSLMFSLLQSGIGGQYIWMGNPWIEMHMGGLSAFIASTGSFLFIEQSLGKEMKPTTRLTMKVGAGLCVFFALLYSFDLIGIQFVTLLVSTLGLVPALLGLPGAISLARRGQKVGWYFLAAWLMYFVSTAIMVEVIKGRIGVSFWTMHSFQFGATFDMLLFMGVLGVQSRAMREEIERTKKEQIRLMALAHSDPLTALPNRRSLYESIDLALKGAGRKQFSAVYMMDLDGFIAINDRCGREAGDELLIAVANRLRGLIGANGVVSRLGGDEFVILATHLQSSQQASDFGFRILQAFDEPFALSATRCQVGLTIGYAIAPLDGNDTSGLLRQADEAMYAGKRMGKNQVVRTPTTQGLSDDELLALL
jgi:diguanylate cyclase (GGDEF)-like protein